MKPYRNEKGNSGVEAYEIVPGGIRIRFVGGDIYRYSVESAGQQNIAEMEKLALKGRGLSTFISREVKNKYAEKEN